MSFGDDAFAAESDLNVGSRRGAGAARTVPSKTVPLPSGSAIAPCFMGSPSSLPKGSGTVGRLKLVGDRIEARDVPWLRLVPPAR